MYQKGLGSMGAKSVLSHPLVENTNKVSALEQGALEQTQTIQLTYSQKDLGVNTEKVTP